MRVIKNAPGFVNAVICRPHSNLREGLMYVKNLIDPLNHKQRCEKRKHARVVVYKVETLLIPYSHGEEVLCLKIDFARLANSWC